MTKLFLVALFFYTNPADAHVTAGAWPALSYTDCLLKATDYPLDMAAANKAGGVATYCVQANNASDALDVLAPLPKVRHD